ncbi:MAG: hypothetical protein K2L47_00115, partial [Clostridia bacterium]|nr:hypothetical protein [Clostridia bacterium]
ITINGGVINNNIASDSGGGIFSYNGSVFNMNGGIIHKNLAIGFGGGVYCSSSNCNITYGIFSYNKADTSVGEGGGLFTDATNVHITGGIYEYNTSIHCGGGIRVGGACDSVEISNIISRYNHADTYSGGVRIASSLSCEAFIKDSIIINNSAKTHGGGMTIEVQSAIGEGLQIYDNTVKDEENNLILSVGVKISGSLMKDGKNTHVGLSNYNVEITKGYTSSGNTMEPNRFFFSDKSGYIVNKSDSGEVKLIEGAKPSSKITWRWGSTSTEMTTSTQVTLPYKVGGYNISIGGSSFYQNTSGINRASGTSFTIVTPGSYAFYADGNYLNSTFMVTIEPPKAEIAKPTIKKYVYVYDDRQQINFTPEGFDSTTMEISYNRTSSVGKHIA